MLTLRMLDAPPMLDTDFRHGIGHHAAHYEQEYDAIVIFDTKDAGTVSRVVGYAEFREKVLDLSAAFELAASGPGLVKCGSQAGFYGFQIGSTVLLALRKNTGQRSVHFACNFRMNCSSRFFSAPSSRPVPARRDAPDRCPG